MTEGNDQFTAKFFNDINKKMTDFVFYSSLNRED